MNIDWLIKRLKEPSSWRGVVMLLTGFGVNISPEMSNQIISTGVAIVGIIGVSSKG